MAGFSVVISVLFYFFVFRIFRMILKGQDPKNRTSRKDSAGTKKRGGRQASTISSAGNARSTDGHVLTGERDITCRKYGHRHAEDAEPRYLVHDDPGGEEYIILNGQRLRLKEADRYFCR